jgi:hypothetical protein
MRLQFDSPVGHPSFELSEDQIAIVIDLLCRGTAIARGMVSVGMLEVPITNHVKKAMRQVKKQLSLTNLEIAGEFELLDTSNDNPEVLGRIDIILKFLHQFGDEDAYLGVECKRVAHGNSDLNNRYVTQGVDRFATGQYAKKHQWGMMLGYVLTLPCSDLIASINNRIKSTYGDKAQLSTMDPHAQSLEIRTNTIQQTNSAHQIQLVHTFVDMTTASPAST